MFVSAIVCVLTIVFCDWVWKVYLKRGHILPPFYPDILPIIGHLHLLVGDRLRLWRSVSRLMVESMKKGGVICVFVGTKLYYCITDPEDALTAANACLQKHFVYEYAKPWLGNGLITGSGEVWKRHRKLLTPAFSQSVVYGYLHVFNSQSRNFVEILKNEVGKPFDQTGYLKSITMETFCQTAFGINDGFVDKEFIKKYMEAADEILNIVSSRFQNIWLQSDIIFKLCGLKKKQDQLIEIVNAMSNKVIQAKKRSQLNDGSACVTKTIGVRCKPFLDLLLELSEENAFTDQEIREEVDTAIVTGFDTTSSLLSFILILLGTHQRVQDKIYEEIKTVLKTDRDVRKEDLQELAYTEAVIKESLRVYTTGPVTLRYVDKDVKLKNYTMRAGSQCIILLLGIHRDPMWGKDVQQFRPERWLDPDNPVNSLAFAGFSIGKRYCLGKTYAMISVKTMLAHILRHYKITADDTNLELRLDLLLKPVSGHEICLEERL